MAPFNARPSSSFQLVLLVFSILSVGLHAIDPPLTEDYYASTCPTALEIVRKEMECAVMSNPRNAALILRLHFHDCFVQVSNFFLRPFFAFLVVQKYHISVPLSISWEVRRNEYEEDFLPRLIQGIGKNGTNSIVCSFNLVFIIDWMDAL